MTARVDAFDLSLAAPLATARGEVTRRRGFLLRVEDGPHAGLGEATPLPGWTETREACERALESAAAALPDWDAALAATADAPAARHAVSLARADLAARRADRPLAAHLASDPAESVPVNATVGDADPDATVERARTAVADGFETLKLKVGARTPEADVARVEAVRDAVDATLRVDANGAWSSDDAEGALTAMPPLEYAEQPVAADDLDAMRTLRDVAPVAADESLRARGVAAVVDAAAADVLVLKPMALGGPDRVLDAARRARDAGLQVVVTTTVDAAVARAGAVHLAAALSPLPACGLATGHLLESDVAPDPVPVRAGAVGVPDGPGLGVDPAEVTTGA